MEASIDIKVDPISTGDKWPGSSGKDNRGEKTYSSKDPAPNWIVKPQEDDKEDQDIKRVSSGIAGLDPLIQGGFPEGKSCLVTGEAGLGKSIFCMQFVLSGLVDGEKAVYVAVDSKPAEIVEEAASMGWDLHQYVEKKQLLILDASPYFSARMVGNKEKEIDITKTVADLASYVKRVGASRVVIDPVGPLIASQNTTNGLRDRSRALIHALQENMGTTNLLTAYAINGARMGGHEAEEFPVNGVVVLKYAREESGLIRTLLLSKMRGTAIDLSEHQFDIVKGKGIVLSPIEPMTPPMADEIAESSESPFGGSLFKEWESEKVGVD